MTIPDELMELWQQHSAAFPKGYGGAEIRSIYLSWMQRSRAALHLYLTDGKLDTQQIKMLRERLIDLNTIVLLTGS